MSPEMDILIHGLLSATVIIKKQLRNVDFQQFHAIFAKKFFPSTLLIMHLLHMYGLKITQDLAILLLLKI